MRYRMYFTPPAIYILYKIVDCPHPICINFSLGAFATKMVRALKIWRYAEVLHQNGLQQKIPLRKISYA